MTEEEAIHKLIQICESQNNEYGCGNENCECYIDTAIEALEKQIPKKLIIKIHPNRIPSEQKVPYCPVCDENLEFHFHPYCCNCGQKLDWNEPYEERNT